jgi:hypothetical protein
MAEGAAQHKGMKKILYISHKPFLPIKDGGTQAMALFFDALSRCKNVEIIYVPMVTAKHAKVELPMATQLIQTTPLKILTKKGLFRFRRILGSIPLNVLRHMDGSSEEMIHELIVQKGIDTIICDGFYAICLLKSEHFKQRQVIYRSHNLESNFWKQRGEFDAWWKRPLFRWIARKMEPFEEAKVRLAGQVLSISVDEMFQLKKWNPNTQLFLPHVTPNSPKQVALNGKNSIGFVGDMEWVPNERAMRRFIATLWPIFHQQFPHVKISLAGKGSEKFTDPSRAIEGLGFVDDLSEFIHQQRFLINPVLEGTGFNMKLLDALTYQIPLISYQSRLSGLTDIPGLLSSIDDHEFIQHMERLTLHDAVIHGIVDKIQQDTQKHFNLKDRVNQLETLLHGG